METENNIKPARYSASQIADYLIFLASQKKIDEDTTEGVTPLKLQKFLYFAQAASLALYNKMLFKDNIEAWKYGPVVSSLYYTYKNNQSTPIFEAAGEYEQVTDEETKKLLKGIFELFDKYSAGELVEITHHHQPWKNFYEEGKNQIIPPEVLRDYYKDIFVFNDITDGA